jgi:hypothetical protein
MVSSECREAGEAWIDRGLGWQVLTSEPSQSGALNGYTMLAAWLDKKLFIA